MIINNISVQTHKRTHLKFGEGKAELYSDFDRTFLPMSHGQFKNINNVSQNPTLLDYFQKLGGFFEKNKEGFKFKITTGRNFDEFRTMAEMARDKKFPMPLPDSLIVKNGGDEHPKIGSDKEFYSGGDYPFNYEKINLEKQKDLKETTGWDGKLIKAKLEEIFKSYDFEIRYPGTTHGTGDYGYRSLFHDLHDNFDPKDETTHHNKSPWVIALRRDGDAKIHITYPKDIHYDEERFAALGQIRSQIEELLTENNIKAYSNSNPKGIESGSNPATVIMPRFKSPSEASAKDLTKLYDTQKAVERAIKENDLIILAGDSSNDVEMLNIGNYMKLDDSIVYQDDIQKEYFEMVHKNPGDMFEVLKRNPQLEEQLKKLPVISIVVKNSKEKNHELGSIVKAFGKYGKAIEVEEGHLLDGIKQAIKMHAENNPLYKEKLSADLREEIFGVAKVLEKKPEDSPKIVKSKGKTGWIVGGLVALGAILGSVYTVTKKKGAETNVNNQ